MDFLSYLISNFSLIVTMYCNPIYFVANQKLFADLLMITVKSQLELRPNLDVEEVLASEQL